MITDAHLKMELKFRNSVILSKFDGKFSKVDQVTCFSVPIGLPNSDYRKRWRDVISQHLGHSHRYKSVMAALLKANIHYGLFAQMT